jgi:chromosome segregation ATPase
MNKKELYVEKFAARLKQWSAKIDEYQAKGEELEADAKIEYKKQIENLKVKMNELEKKIISLKEPGNEAWEELKTGAEKAWEELSEAVKKAADKFKNSHS